MAQQEACIDLSYLQSISNNDQDFVAEMVSSFIHDTPKYLNDIKTQFEIKDYQGLYKTIHKFASTLAFVGANQKNEVFDKLEHLAKQEKDDSQIEKYIEEITRYCTNVVEQLRKTNK